MSTMEVENDAIDLGDAEDFKLPTDGVHNGNLNSVEFLPTKAGDREQFILSVVLSPDDPDAPNLPMRYFMGWPVPEDKDVFWGSRTAYGAKIKTLKDAMTAFGGQESGAINKTDILAFLTNKIGMAVKVKTKQSLRTDPVTKQPLDPPEMQVNVDKLLPA